MSASRSEISGLRRHCRPVDLSPRDRAGVYLLLLGDEVVYVGASKDVEFRIGQHLVAASIDPDRRFDGAMAIPLPIAVHGAYEGALIRALRPRYNGAAPANREHDAEILEGLDLGHLVPGLRPFGRPLARTSCDQKRAPESTQHDNNEFHEQAGKSGLADSQSGASAQVLLRNSAFWSAA